MRLRQCPLNPVGYSPQMGNNQRGWAVANLAEIPPAEEAADLSWWQEWARDADFGAGWHSVRSHFGITAFGVNASEASAGKELIAPHDEAKYGSNEEHYLVVRGRALFQGGGFHCTIGKWPSRPFNWRDYDVLAFYVIPCQAWYLIPTTAIHSSPWAITFYPHIHNSKGRYEKYREAWHLVGAKRRNFAAIKLRSTKENHRGRRGHGGKQKKQRVKSLRAIPPGWSRPLGLHYQARK